MFCMLTCKLLLDISCVQEEEEAVMLGTRMDIFFFFLPNDKISAWSRLKAFSDDKIRVTEKLKFVLGMGTKHYGKKKKC